MTTKNKEKAPVVDNFIYCTNCSRRVKVETDKDTICLNEKCNESLIDHAANTEGFDKDEK